MKSKDELIYIYICLIYIYIYWKSFYYFDDICKDVDIYFSNILLDETLYENISIIYDIQNKTSKVPKPFRIKFNEIEGFVRVRGDGFIHLVLFDYEFFDKIRDKIKYLIGQKKWYCRWY